MGTNDCSFVTMNTNKFPTVSYVPDLLTKTGCNTANNASTWMPHTVQESTKAGLHGSCFLDAAAGIGGASSICNCITPNYIFTNSGSSSSSIYGIDYGYYNNIASSSWNGGMWVNDFASQIKNRNKVSLWDSWMAGLKEGAYTNSWSILAMAIPAAARFFDWVGNQADDIGDKVEGKKTPTENMC